MSIDSDNDVVIQLEATLSKLSGAARLQILTPLAWFLRQSNPERALLLAEEAQSLLAQSNGSVEDNKVASENLTQISEEARLLAAEEARLNDRRLRRKQQMEREQLENEAQWQAAAAALPAAAGYDRMVIPSAPKKLAPLAQRRLDLYHDYLAGVINEAFALKARQQAGQKLGRTEIAQLAPPRTPGAISADTAAWLGKFCTVCSGGCCVKGKDTAYVMVQTIIQFINAHPAMLPEQVLNAYLSHVQPKTIAGSCINHTEQGCSLPREMRSHVCNNYLCDPLTEFVQQKRGQAGVKGVIVITRKKNNWQRYTDLDNRIIGADIVDGDGITPTPLI